ncbi:MAG TPA: alpha/beta hydrolase [Dehalococcoidia bacterium]|jgi:pimeloyl-ACP methyl ester carboxylesterase|nr:alpha/beta hydrolase [Dehalococcoidia bacterium]
MRFDTGEVEIDFEMWEGESPPILILHGGGCDRQMYEPLLPVRDRLKAFAYDARGHGRSSRSDRYRFTDHANDAISFIDGVIHEPVLLLGHSLGAMTSLAVAANRPDLATAAILLDPPLYAPEFGLRHFEAPFRMVQMAAGQPFEAIVGPITSVGLPEAFARSISWLDGAFFGQMIDGSAFEGWETDKFLRSVRCAVLLQHGQPALGSALYPGEVERASTLLKDCRLLEVSDSGHSPFERLPELLPALSDFIRSATSREAAT